MDYNWIAVRAINAVLQRGIAIFPDALSEVASRVGRVVVEHLEDTHDAAVPLFAGSKAHRLVVDNGDTERPPQTGMGKVRLAPLVRSNVVKVPLRKVGNDKSIKQAERSTSHK
jgi:hypothetical protein